MARKKIKSDDHEKKGVLLDDLIGIFLHKEGKMGIVNPYLFYLAKRMLDYEFFGMGQEPSILQITNKIYDRHKRSKYKNTFYSDSKTIRDSTAYSKAQRLQKYVLSSKDFRFSKVMLDQMISEITVLGNFSSWTDFVSKFGDDLQSQIVKTYLKDNKLLEKDFFRYKELANSKLALLHEQHNLKKLYHIGGYNKRTQSISYLIQSANENDLKQIQPFFYKPYTSKILEAVQEFHLKQFHSIFILKDSYSTILGYFFLVPVTEDYYNKLSNGKTHKRNLTENDLELPSANNKAKYFLFEPQFYDTILSAMRMENEVYGILQSRSKHLQSDIIIFGTAEKPLEAMCFEEMNFHTSRLAIKLFEGILFSIYQYLWRNYGG